MKKLIIGLIMILLLSGCEAIEVISVKESETENSVTQTQQESFISIGESDMAENPEETVKETETLDLRTIVNAPVIDEFTVTVDGETMFNVYADVEIPGVDSMNVIKGQWKVYAEEDIAKVWEFCKTETAVLNDTSLIDTMVSRTYSDIEMYKGYEQNQLTEDALKLFNLFLDYQKNEMTAEDNFHFTEMIMPDESKKNLFIAAVKDGIHEGYMSMSDKDINFNWDADNWIASTDCCFGWLTMANADNKSYLIGDKTLEVDTLGFEKHLQVANQFIEMMGLKGYSLQQAVANDAVYKANEGKTAYTLVFEKRQDGINVSSYGIAGSNYNMIIFNFVEEYLERIYVGKDFDAQNGVTEKVQLLSYDEIKNIIITGDYWNKEYLPELKDGKFWPTNINKLVLEYALLENEDGQISLVPCWNLYGGYEPGQYELRLSINAVDGSVINCYTLELEKARLKYE